MLSASKMLKKGRLKEEQKSRREPLYQVQLKKERNKELRQRKPCLLSNPCNKVGSMLGNIMPKAIRCVQAALPISPWKKLCIVESLAKQVELNLESSPVRAAFRILILLKRGG